MNEDLRRLLERLAEVAPGEWVVQGHQFYIVNGDDWWFVGEVDDDDLFAEVIAAAVNEARRQHEAERA